MVAENPATKIVARVVNSSYVRVVGATPTQMNHAFSQVKRVWSARGITLARGVHDEHRDWYHVTFPTERLDDQVVAAFAIAIRNDFDSFFKNVT